VTATLPGVHPIEHLRYLARADSTEAARMVGETATALGSLGNDPATLVLAVRRILERHASVGPMWWMCAHLLVAADVYDRAWDLADEVADDPTADVLDTALTGIDRAEVAIVVLAAGSPDRLLVSPKMGAEARVAAAAEQPVWLVTPVGTCLPTRYVEAVAEAAGPRLVELDRAVVSRVIGPHGASADVRAALRPTAPLAPELLRVPTGAT